jgi:hypothetical protein
MRQTIAIATPPIEIVFVNQNSPNARNLVALWQLDEQNKLYCQWIKQTTNTNN